MANRSRELIRTEPIGDIFNNFHHLFPGISTTLDQIDNDGKMGFCVLEAESNMYLDPQVLASILIRALLALPASRQLLSSRGGKSLNDDLSRLKSTIPSSDFDIKQIFPLLEAVLNKEPDKVIWNKA